MNPICRMMLATAQPPSYTGWLTFGYARYVGAGIGVYIGKRMDDQRALEKFLQEIAEEVWLEISPDQPPR